MGNLISASEAMEIHGFDEFELSALTDSLVPACCDEGCEVEPDGHCEHGHPSVLIKMGMI